MNKILTPGMMNQFVTPEEQAAIDRDLSRRERVEFLLSELRREITLGMMGREIAETLTFSFVVPSSFTRKDAAVHCELRCRPRSLDMIDAGMMLATPELQEG